MKPEVKKSSVHDDSRLQEMSPSSSSSSAVETTTCENSSSPSSSFSPSSSSSLSSTLSHQIILWEIWLCSTLVSFLFLGLQQWSEQMFYKLFCWCRYHQYQYLSFCPPYENNMRTTLETKRNKTIAKQKAMCSHLKIRGHKKQFWTQIK